MSGPGEEMDAWEEYEEAGNLDLEDHLERELDRHFPKPATPVETIRPRHPFETRCQSCQAPIVWFNTPKGKKMPVDAASTRPTDAAHQLDLTRHVSHFATCPNAAKHRRG